MNAIVPHRPRPARLIRREEIHGWRMKIYGIATPGRAPRADLVEETVAKASQVLPDPAMGDDCYGLGFAIAHDAATMAIALIYWWQFSNELHQRVFTAPVDAPRALTKLADPGAGCVWELGVIDFERRAWVEDVLANPAGPDFDRYFSRELHAAL
jgi:hypothetical protein